MPCRAVKSEAKKLIIICPPLKASIRKALRQLDGSDFRWAYFGENVSKAIAIEKQLSGTGQRIEIAEELQKTAHSLRQPYIDYIGKLSLENNSISWWVSSLSEKNPFVSKTFLYTCYVKLYQTILNSSDQETFVFIAENRALRKCLVQNILDSHKCKIHRVESLTHTSLEALKNALVIGINKGYFIARTIYRLLLARCYGLNQVPNEKLQKGKGLILLHNWVDQRSFDAMGNYRDSYFGELAHHLRKRGENVVVVPWVLGTVSYRQTLKKMVQSSESFLVPEAFLKISDVFRAFVKALFNLPPKRAHPHFKGLEISEIIADDFRRDWSGNRTASSLLLYDVVKRWRNSGTPIGVFIHTYENHVWEKAYCIALREFYPLTKTIGYQHATVSKMHLNYFFSKDELSILPLPDKVITNGKYVERLFKESGYDPKKTICGGAIRYAGMLNKRRNTVVGKNTSRPVILVTPSIDKSESTELVWKVLAAFTEVKNYRIILKFHPVLPYHSIAKDLGILPKHFIVSDKPIGELLEEADVLLYTSSTTCIEALSLGVPVLHIESDFIIGLDPLDFSPDIRRSAKNKDEIVRMTREILEIDEKELSEQRAIWKEAVSEVFEPVDEGVFGLFL